MKKTALVWTLCAVLALTGCGMGGNGGNGGGNGGSNGGGGSGTVGGDTGSGNGTPQNTTSDLLDKNGALKDGVYTATQDEYDEDTGWKDSATVTVENGEIVDVDWNGKRQDEEMDKKTYSQSGLYGMKEKGGAQAEWHEEAELAEKYFVDHKGQINLDYDNNGKTDAISGVTIKVQHFFKLAEKALEDAREL